MCKTFFKYIIAGVLSVFFVLDFVACMPGPDLLKRTDKPLSRNEVSRSGVDFPFPASAHNIYYAQFGKGQEWEYIVRFQSTQEDCITTISAALTWHDKISGTASVYTAVPLINPTKLPVSSTPLSPVPWFDGIVINRGIYVGEDKSHRPNIWIDQDNAVFYYRETD